MLLRCYICSIN